jgi:hypothetical protein
MQRFRGAPEMQLLGDGDEPADLGQIQVCDAGIVSVRTTSVLDDRAVARHRFRP